MPEQLVKRQLDPSRKLWPEEWLNQFAEAIKECGSSYRDIARGYMKTLCVYDYSYFRMLRKHFGDQRALQIHKETWLRNVPDYLDHAKKLYDLKEPLNLTGLGYLIKYAFNQQGCRFDITESKDGKLVARITNCILTEYAKKRFPPDGDAVYQESIRGIHNALVDKLAQVCNLRHRLQYAIEDRKLVINSK